MSWTCWSDASPTWRRSFAISWSIWAWRSCGVVVAPAPDPAPPAPRGLVPAGSPVFRSGDSKDGVEQLIGNAQEWTATVVRDDAKHALVLHETWNERDRVPGLLTMGGGYMNDADSVPNLTQHVKGIGHRHGDLYNIDAAVGQGPTGFDKLLAIGRAPEYMSIPVF